MQSQTVHRQTDRIVHLEEEVRQLREAIYPIPDEYPWELGLSKCQTALFLRLAKTVLVRHEDLLNTLEQATGRPSSESSLKVLIWKMRRRFEKTGAPYRIVNVWGVGYRLTKEEPKTGDPS